MSAALAGPATFDHVRALVRFRGGFHDMAESGELPAGACPYHVHCVAWFIPPTSVLATVATPDGEPPAFKGGWNGVLVPARSATGGSDEPLEIVHFPSRQQAEQWLLRGAPLADTSECGCGWPAPRALEAAT